MTQENKEIEETKISHTTENVESVGQMILGEIEKIGGILTADPITQAEGDYNLNAGSMHQEANKNLTAIDEAEARKTDETEKV
jgi:hypothetical protein